MQRDFSSVIQRKKLKKANTECIVISTAAKGQRQVVAPQLKQQSTARMRNLLQVAIKLMCHNQRIRHYK
ncbi:MAG: hypothetical protein COY58_06885 [Gammaproteobacteria bacterium CG_4_10_14_0_8_um_filter_38_16]|nr:MAG: hypothetical protein COY58_06885 [Gammaproteobacteria bacterium CG_4_10_14_0_8_um_filter_38_16]PJA04189.1 MAG: hypothetical protein COX72_01030 [Gammaproteobacteria bacterium CG_4_10_14_0_2_um_filter_38_22]PJB10368.1 MAG: hypothetical protein CO120_05265 [Gammaproteobacteria bacterium CG_4_9_14_3_um_filter_38_9]